MMVYRAASLLTMLHLFGSLAGATETWAKTSIRSPEPGHDEAHTILSLVVPHIPDEQCLFSLLLALPMQYSEQRQSLIHRLRSLRIGRWLRIGHVGRLLYPSSNMEIFHQDLKQLLEDSKPNLLNRILQTVHVKRAPRLHLNAMEIRLLRELGTESNQIMLAYKLFNVMRSFKEGDATVGLVVKFLYDTCGYTALPMHLLSWCFMHNVDDYRTSVLEKYVIPLASVLPANVLAQIESMFPSWWLKWFNGPDNIRELFEFSHPSGNPYLTTLSEAQHTQFRGQYDHIRTMSLFGVRLDVRAVLSWNDVTIGELRQLAPFMSIKGFWTVVAQSLPQKAELIAELLRTRSFVTQLDASLEHHISELFLACQLAIALRSEAGTVLQDLLRIPQAIPCLRKQWSQLESTSYELKQYPTQDELALLNAIRSAFEANGRRVVNENLLVLNLNALKQHLDTFQNH